jgi:5-methyltetrahydrofolate--homocysteine methyltransferase
MQTARAPRFSLSRAFYILPGMKKTEAYLALEAAARERILILDGAMGSMLQRLGLAEEDYRSGPLAAHPGPLKGDNDALSLSRPEAPLSVHRAYLEAGADIVTTNSFGATRISQADYGLSELAADMARESARIARRAADEFTARDPAKRRFVAGSLGPTSKTLSISPDAGDPAARAIGFEEMAAAYREEANALVAGGADILLVETVFDTLNAKAAIYAILSLFEEKGERWPVMISGTIVDKAGRTLSGQTTAAFLASVAHAGPFAVGFNCSLGVEALLARAEEIAAISPFNLSVYPNAGLPNAEGGYDESPELFATAFSRFAREVGVNLAGGCCGTTPDHIAAVSAALAGIPPRRVPERRRMTSLSGLEALDIGPGSLFVNVGERSNVSGSKKFARLVREGRREEAVRVAAEQVEAGAQAVDVNMDDPLIDALAEMRAFLNFAAGEPDLARVPVMIDSSSFATIVAGLRCVQGKCVVNSISLKEGEAAFLEQAREIAKYGAAVVVMAFDEEGQAATLERRLSILARARRLLAEGAGYANEDIILDPNVFAVGTGIDEHRRYALDFFEATRLLKERFPGCLVSGGVSNVSFSFRGNDALREAIHTVFLYHAKAAGMDMGIVNPGALGVYDEIEPGLRERIEDLLLDRRPDATERLLEEAAGIVAAADSGRAEPEWRRLPPGERLVHALVNGLSEWAAADADEARRVYSDSSGLGGAIEVISGPLMEGMNRVGDLFGSGKMFLPQVVKSARVMKAAVGAILPYLKEGESGASSRGKVVLATVKGDVHDIGKNIVSVVLQCNGYEVVDLGVMVPCDDILDAAESRGAVAVGLSGLITPSLEEMTRVAREMERRGMRQPLLVGGAATSLVHTALKIAPAYSGLVVNVRDASLAPNVLARLLDPAGREAYAQEIAALHEGLRRRQREKAETARRLGLGEARKCAFRADFGRYAPPKPLVRGVVERRPTLGELVPYIDWRFFFYEWGMKEPYPAILDDPERGPEARRLKLEAEAMLSRMEAEGRVKAAGLCAILPAASSGDDMLVYADESRRSALATFPFLRQQRVKEDGSPQLCLADYLAPEAPTPDRPGGVRDRAPVKDWAGVFAVTAGIGLDEAAREREAAGDDFGAIMLKILCDRLAEAFAEKMHAEVRRRIWGFAPDERFAPGELPTASYRGIRPAPGYPACPDHRDKAAILRLLGARERIGMGLTESFMMVPAASVSGFYFSHPDAKYFAIGKIGPDQLADYAARRGESPEEAERAIRESLG